MLALALLLLPLPFVEVACSSPPPFGGTVTLLDQSGIQVMTGTYSERSDLEDQFRRMAPPGAIPPPAPKPLAGGKVGKADLTVKPSVLMIVVPVLVLSAAIVGLALGRVAIRLPLVASLVAVAVMLVVVQMAVGFPIDTAVREKIRAEQAKAQKLRQQNPFPGPGGFPMPGGDPFAQMGEAMAAQMLGTRYTVWFWLWLVLMAGALGPVIGEGIWYASRRAEYRRTLAPDY
jgi:hypothetical protein